MRGLLADANCEGHMEVLARILTSKEWDDLWKESQLVIETFDSLKLDRKTPDKVLWQLCQVNGLVLITQNRKDEGPESLQTTIRLLNQSDSLPVVTLADGNEVLRSGAYAGRVVEDLMDYLLYMENFLGTGRLWVPRGTRQ